MTKKTNKTVGIVAGLIVVFGLAGIAAGGGYFVWEQKKSSEEMRTQNETDTESLTEENEKKDRVESVVKTEDKKEEKTAPTLAPEEARDEIESRTKTVIQALYNQNMSALKTLVHPQKGVRFSPYTMVNLEQDVVIPQSQIDDALLQSPTITTWGVYDGTGMPIELTTLDYIDEFVNNHNYQNADQISYNEQIGEGNTINNINQVYPGNITVEYHFTGFDESFVGLDWESLRLVYEQLDDTWYLVGVVHDQWTI